MAVGGKCYLLALAYVDRYLHDLVVAHSKDTFFKVEHHLQNELIMDEFGASSVQRNLLQPFQIISQVLATLARYPRVLAAEAVREDGG